MSYPFDWGLPFRRPYVEWLVRGLAMTAALTAASSAGSLVLGVVAAVARFSRVRLVRLASLVFVEVFRGVPTLCWLLFFYYVMPNLLGESIARRLNAWAGFPVAAALVALIAVNGAHVAEIVRSGISALPRAQERAGLSLGLHPLRVWCSIIVPQALRVSLPALGPRMVHNLHNTSLALVLAVREFTWQTQQIETTTFRGFEAITVASLTYVVLSTAMTLGFRLLERRSRRHG